MTKILVTYATHSGSTARVAQAVADCLAKQAAVDVLPVEQVTSLEGYSGVVLGAPMIMGWHRSALAFLKRHRAALSQVPLALFVTCLSLHHNGETSSGATPVFIDESLPPNPQAPAWFDLKARYTRLSNYLAPIHRAAPELKPVSVAFFSGCLQYYRLAWWAILFVMLIIQPTPGDRRNWKAIETWASRLMTLFQ